MPLTLQLVPVPGHDDVLRVERLERGPADGGVVGVQAGVEEGGEVLGSAIKRGHFGKVVIF